MKRRNAPVGRSAAKLPPDLAAGPCIEVWTSPEERPEHYSGAAMPLSLARLVKSRFHDARNRYADRYGLSRQQMFELMPDRRTYSQRETT